MRAPLRITAISVMLGLLWAGCTGVKFAPQPPAACSNMNAAYGEGSCKIDSGRVLYDYSVTLGDVDILFVDDNSGSMYVEQEKMANQFPGFLDSISTLDYQIAIISTDVEKNTPGSKGKFFDFGGGQNILRNSSRLRDATHSANITKFQNTIKRSETLDCPSGSNCPSGDERGIYALNLALDSGGGGFFRPGGHLAVVILSDEDERSTGGGAPGSSVNGGPISQSYLAQDYDLPRTFVQKIATQLTGAKSVSVHSIIIKPSTTISAQDNSCWYQQNNQGGGVKGFFGTQYAALSVPSEELKAMGPIVRGTLGSICSSNYTAEMGQIASFLNQKQIALPCQPEDGSLKVEFDPAQPGVSSYVDADNILHFTPPIAAGVEVHLKYSCPL